MRICFVRLFAFPLFDPSAAGGIGGAEVRAYNFARAMARNCTHEISFAVKSLQPREPERIGDITVYFDYQQTSRPQYGELKSPSDIIRRVPLVAWKRIQFSARKRIRRIQTPRPRVKRLYTQAGADVYCCFGANDDSADAVKSAKRTGKKSVLFLASDNDLCDAYRDGVREVDELGAVGLLCRYAIQNADRIIVQTEWQRRRLAERFGRDGVVIRNPIDLARVKKWTGLFSRNGPEGPLHTRPPSPFSPERFALWIGRDDSFAKRPDRCIELAKRCPEVPFVMVVNRKDPASYDRLVQSAPANVHIVERVPFDRIEDYFQQAAVLVNTSSFEGFPNTFLQAGKFALPILSWKVDPAGMLGTHGCGRTAGEDPERMAALLRQFIAGGAGAESIGQAGRRYVETYHKIEDRVAELEAVLRDVVRQGERRPDHTAKAA